MKNKILEKKYQESIGKEKSKQNRWAIERNMWSPSRHQHIKKEKYGDFELHKDLKICHK